MIIIFDLTRIKGESEEKYLWRIGQAKDSGKLDMNWNQISQVLNKEFRESESEYRTEDAYRKRYNEAKKFYEAGVFRGDSDDKYSKQIMEQKRDLERARIAFRDERNAWQKQNYTAARVEQRLDYLEEQLKSCGKKHFEDISIISSHKNSEASLVVPIADLHIGQCFKSIFGEYNSDIAKEELNKYLREVVEIGELHNVNTVNVCCLGDQISGSIHKSLTITNRENVIEQVKLASELIASFCHELCKYFTSVYFYSVNGNHSRIDKKEDALKDERLDDIVSWSVCNILNHINNFFPMVGESFDSTMDLVTIHEKTYLLIHGDMDDVNKNGVANLVMMLGFVPDYIITAHKHTYAFTASGVEVYQTGSFVPSGDDHTVQKRLSGKASQTVLVCDKSGVKCSYNVKLS